MLTALAKSLMSRFVVGVMLSLNPLGVTNHCVPRTVPLLGASAMAFCSRSTPTKATPVVPEPELAEIAAEISPIDDAAPPGANFIVPASSRPFAPSASAIEEFTDRPHSSLRTTVTTESTSASAITRAMKWPCLPAVIAVRNRLSSGVDSDSASEA